MTRTANGHLVPNNQVSQGRVQSINLIEYIVCTMYAFTKRVKCKRSVARSYNIKGFIYGF